MSGRLSIQEQLQSILLLFIFIASGFMLGILAKENIRINDDTVILFLIFLPTIGYIIFSGRLSSLKGPGGLEAQFAAAAGNKIELALKRIDESSLQSASTLIKEGNMKNLRDDLIHNLDETKPVILTLTLGKRGYLRDKLLESLNTLSFIHQTSKFIVFLDQQSKFVAYISFWQIMHILNDDNLGNLFVNCINNNDIEPLGHFPGIITKTISMKSTNIEALQEMSDLNLKSAIIIDENKKIKGVIHREQILTKLMLSTVKGS